MRAYAAELQTFPYAAVIVGAGHKAKAMGVVWVAAWRPELATYSNLGAHGALHCLSERQQQQHQARTVMRVYHI